MEERIALGRKLLVELTHADFGYDLQRWHDHLKQKRDGGYTWNRTVTLPKIMRAALASREWRAAVAKLAASELELATDEALGRADPH